MRDLLGPGTWVGYCTNVHPGESWREIRANLERYTLPIKEAVCPHETMGIGLWLSATTARQIIDDALSPHINEWLRERGLRVFTLNGFPHDNFHGEVVKDRVYRPDWCTGQRVQYTCDLISILSELMDEGDDASISTLPLGWPGHGDWDERSYEASRMQLRAALIPLVHEYEHTGKLIHLDLEPEPGCRLQRSLDAVMYFREWLHTSDEAENFKRHIGICHDVCHAAVMFEEQEDAIGNYAAADIKLGKVQVSSAVCADFRGLDQTARAASQQAVARFREDRYLHQSCARPAREAGRPHDIRFYTDLPELLAEDTRLLETDEQWRVHFHVPIFQKRLGAAGTTQDAIIPAVRAALAVGCRHFEIETYAWNVLPPEHRPKDLAEGIANELIWFRDLVKREIRP